MNASQTLDGAAPPLAFLSYAHEGDEHSEWIRSVATRLRDLGVDVRLDQWHLQLGGDLSGFMTSSVRQADFVLIVCTPLYAKKANSGLGGVGFEGSIIAGSLLADEKSQSKFIPLLRSGTPAESIPMFLWNRLYVDFSDDHLLSASIENLARHIHGRPSTVPPPIRPFRESELSSRSQFGVHIKPRRWILVAGTGDTDRLPKGMQRMSETIGEKLAQGRYGLVTGGWPGVDRVVGETFAARLSAEGLPLENFLTQVVEQSWEPPFRAGSVIPVPSGEAEYIESVKRADAAVLIGGLGGTYQTGEYMRIAGKPVFPLVESGGDAKKFFDRMCTKWYEGCIPNVTKARYLQLGQSSRTAMDQVMEALKLWSQ